MTEYLVPYESAESEFEEKRSRFISHVFLVESEAEARGGILLGAGGLTRAYAKAAKDALDNAGKARMQPFSVLLLECPYPMFERIKLLIEGHEGRIESSDYGAAVTLTFLLPVQKTADFSAALTELSGGQMSAEEGEQRFLPGARE